MKTLFSILAVGIAALVFAACQGATNTNTARNSAGDMNGMDHNTMPMNGNSNMAMDMPMESSPNAASQPFDLQFIDTMTEHHRSAITMAKMAVEKTQNAELKTFAQKIISGQNTENAQMKDWREKWFAGKPLAINMKMAGMTQSMPEMKKLETATGKDFDLAFLDAMIPHHAGAVTMAKEALDRAERPEIKTMANQIIKAQEAEIKRMQAWKTASDK